MAKSWQELTKLVGSQPMLVEKIRLTDTDIAIEGPFELPPLARLSMEDQIFVAAFIQADGSIKEMERFYGVSYPTIKNRLRKISEKLNLVEITAPPSKTEILDKIEKGEISVEEALEMMK